MQENVTGKEEDQRGVADVVHLHFKSNIQNITYNFQGFGTFKGNNFRIGSLLNCYLNDV